MDARIIRKGTAMAAIHPADNKPATPASRETLYAIIGSFILSIILATILVGSPFRALRLAYLDYSHTPAGGAAKASPTEAPKTQGSEAPAPPK